MRAVAGTRRLRTALLATLVLATLLLGGALVLLTRLSPAHEALALLVSTRLPLTAVATVTAPILSGLLGVGIGLVGAYQGEWANQTLRALVAAGTGLCLLWAALIGIAWVAVHTELLPTLADDPAGRMVLALLSTLLLPALAVMSGAAVAIAWHVRAAARTLSREGFVHAARLNGLPTTGLVVRRVLRRTLPAILLVLAAELIVLYCGALVLHAFLSQPTIRTGVLPMLPPESLPWVLGVAILVTGGTPALVASIRMARRGTADAPPRAAAIPAPPATLLPSEDFRAAELLDIRDLQIGLPVAVDSHEPSAGINLTVPRGQALALIGDEASVATQLCQAILGVLPRSSPVRSGSILFDGRELVALSEREFRRLRRDQIGFLDVPSPPRLDPQARIGRALTTRLAGRPWAGGASARLRAVELLAQVGVEDPQTVLGRHPHQLTTATAQRVLLAHALALDPVLVITIDPTLGLDADAETAFLDRLHSLQRERGFTLLVVSARLDVVRRCDRAAVLRADTIVEHASVDELLTEPGHLYSRDLLSGDTAGLAPTDS